MSQRIKENSENYQNPKPNDTKILQNETSVYEHYAELKEDAITQQGYFDLAKVPGLYVDRTAQFLKNLREQMGLSQIKFAEKLGINKWTFIEWERSRKRIPLTKLVEIAKFTGLSKDKIYSLIDQGIFKLNAPLPGKFEEIRDLIQFLKPPRQRHKNVTVLKCPPKIIEQIEKIGFQVKRSGRGMRLNSTRLYDYLVTFFRYNKVPKIHPPLTKDVKFWHGDDIDLKRAIICPCLQSDGTIQHGRRKIVFYGKNKILHDYFLDAMYYEYDELPSTYLFKRRKFIKRWSVSYNTEYVEKKEIIKEIMKLAGNTKTSPAHEQSVKNYLKEPQPHLNYLVNSGKTEKSIAFRIWASTEGAISIGGSKAGISISLRIGCAHPKLVGELQQAAKQLQMNLKIEKAKKNWSGIQGLLTYSMKNLIEFIRIGGFISEVKISSNSPYHEGIPKDVLTLGILEYFRQRHMNQWPQKLPMAVHHDNINKIIRNREFKSASYYIDYFS